MRNQQNPAAAGWIGHVLAGHRIDAFVGEGGMGVVYRATHLHLRRTVALKVLPPALAADLEYRRRFEREAAIAASLEHPAVVPIYDAGHAGGVLYLSMRYVEGEDLGALLQREGPLPVDRLCALLGPIADALDAVHEAGLVHRDVKPGNVLIARPERSRAGRVYLCDFGIAKGRADAGRELTSAGQYVGTLQYSSPEQIQGRWLDGRSDQYGLACLAFRCLTGQAPYPRDDTSAVIYAHLAAEPPRPGLLRPELPAAVDAVIARAAAKDPDQRFPSCSAFIAALWSAGAAVRPGAPHPARTVPVPGRPSPDPRHPAGRPGAGAARRPLPHTLPLPEPSHPSGPAPAAPERPAAEPPGHGPVSEPRSAPDPEPPAGGDPRPAAPDAAPARPAPEPPATPGRAPAARPGAGAEPPPPAAPGAPAARSAAGAEPPAPAAPGSGPEVGRPRRPAPSGGAGDADGGVPAPLDVRAERAAGDPSITVTWTAGSDQDVEYKVSRLAGDGRWQVVGRTGTTSIIDGAVAPDAEVPVYGVVARFGAAVSALARSTDAAPPPDPAQPAAAQPDAARPDAARPDSSEPGAPGPDGFLPVQDLSVAGPGTLVFAWPDGVTEAMVVVRRDRPPVSPSDPEATSWKITNMRYQIDGGLRLPPSVTPPCHVAVASCRRERGALVVAPGFGPSARATVT